MRQPRFLRHLVEKFLQKGQEANANLYPGILPIWETQPIGVTRLPISVMKVDSYVRDLVQDLSGELNEPRVWTQLTNQAGNAEVVIASGIPAGTIIQLDTLITPALAPTAGVLVALRLIIPGGSAVWAGEALLGIDALGPLHFESPFLIFDRILDIVIEVAGISPVGQTIKFSTTICLFPNRE